MLEDPRRECLVELLTLRDVALHQHDGERLRWHGLLEPPHAEHDPRGKQRRARGAPPPAESRHGREQQCHQSQAMHADPCRGLDEHVAERARDLPDTAPGVPGKTGQHELPRQIRQDPGAGQRQDARPARRRQARHEARGGDKRSEPGRRPPAPRAAPATRSAPPQTGLPR